MMSLDMESIIARVRNRRGKDCIDSHGVCQATPEVAEWFNRLYAMKDKGATPDECRIALESDRLALRKAGHNI